jgi:hypothetical protein
VSAIDPAIVEALGLPPCIHPTIHLIYAPPGGRWLCDRCEQQFTPSDPLALPLAKAEGRREARERVEAARGLFLAQADAVEERGGTDQEADAYRHAAAILRDIALAPLIADTVHAARAEAWDEGLQAGMDLGVSIGERVHGLREDWPAVPRNPYRAAEAVPGE